MSYNGEQTRTDGQPSILAAIHRGFPDDYDANANLYTIASASSTHTPSRPVEETDPTSTSAAGTVIKRNRTSTEAARQHVQNASSSSDNSMAVNPNSESSRSDDSTVRHRSARMLTGVGGVAEGLNPRAYLPANESFSFSEIFESLSSPSRSSLGTMRSGATIDELERGPEPVSSDNNSTHHTENSDHRPSFSRAHRLSPMRMSMAALSCLCILSVLAVAAYFNLIAIEGPWKVSKIVNVAGCFAAISCCILGMYSLQRNLLEITAVALVIILFMILLAT